MSELAPLSDRNVGWLRYLHRKATTRDSWDREDHPHEHWDNISEAPMLCYVMALGCRGLKPEGPLRTRSQVLEAAPGP